MLEIRLSSDQVVAFDGRVLEVFEATGSSQRFHVEQLEAPALVDDGDGRALVFAAPRIRLGVGREELPAAKRLLAALEQAGR